MLSCVECHHTDQPAASLKPPLKTSERAVLLTTEALAAADAKGVKKCRACHLQAGDDSAPMPAIQYPDKPTPTKLNNEVAYHLNCNVCHDKAIAARPALKGKIPGSNDCVPCHKPAGENPCHRLRQIKSACNLMDVLLKALRRSSDERL